MSAHTITYETHPQELLDLLASMWIELRSSHMISGQPRGKKSGEGLALAQKALAIASTTTDSGVQAEAHRMVAYALNANEQYEDSIEHYQQALGTLDTVRGKEALSARTRNPCSTWPMSCRRSTALPNRSASTSRPSV